MSAAESQTGQLSAVCCQHVETRQMSDMFSCNIVVGTHASTIDKLRQQMSAAETGHVQTALVTTCSSLLVRSLAQIHNALPALRLSGNGQRKRTSPWE